MTDVQEKWSAIRDGVFQHYTSFRIDMYYAPTLLLGAEVLMCV